MIEGKIIAFTDQEVEDIAKQFDKNAYVDYLGGNVMIEIPDNDGNTRDYYFAEILNEIYPELKIDKNDVTIYDYGNVIFNNKDIAAVVLIGV